MIWSLIYGLRRLRGAVCEKRRPNLLILRQATHIPPSHQTAPLITCTDKHIGWLLSNWITIIDSTIWWSNVFLTRMLTSANTDHQTAPMNENNDTESIRNLCRDRLNISITRSDISNAYRLPKGKGDQSRSILVRFTNHRSASVAEKS